MTLIAAVMLIPLSLTAGRPSGSGGRSATTTWTQTCAAQNGFSGTITGSLQLSNTGGAVGGPISTSCTTGGKATGTGSVTNSTTPTKFSWTIANCSTQLGAPVVVTGSVGTTYTTYACYTNGVIQSSGQLKVVNK